MNHWTFTVIVGAALGGCPGFILDPPASQQRSRAATEGETQSAITCAVDPRQPIRRLTHAEVLTNLRTLVPGFDMGSVSLTSDAIAGYYDTNIAALSSSATLVDDYRLLAERAATAVRAGLPSYLPGCTMANGASCFEAFVRRFGRRTFRRSLDAEEVARFSAFFSSGPTEGLFEDAAEVVVQAMLQSPDFLYRPEIGAAPTSVELAPVERASRLSFLIWGAMPDDALLDAAEAGTLETTEQIAAQTERLLQDARAKNGMVRFYSQWLDERALSRTGKNPEEQFDLVRDSMNESLDRFVLSTIEANGTVADLLTSRKAWVDARVAPLFGVAPPPSGQWQEVTLPENERAGVLTHPVMLAGHAHKDYGSPVLRGVHVLSRLLCSPPTPPPPGTAMGTPPASESGRPLTNREGYERVTSNQGATCRSCHSVINPFGFAFENYDTMGRFRTTDNGQPIDSSGSAMDFTFNNAIELSQLLAESEIVGRCVTEHWLDYALAESGLSKDACFVADIHSAFAQSGYQLRSVVLAIATHPRFSNAALLREPE